MNDTKRPYQSPKLVEWGSVVELTQLNPYPCFEISSAFSGSVPCEYDYKQPA